MPLGYVRGSDPVIWANTLPLLGDLEQLRSLIRNHAADCLFVASSALTFEDIPRALVASEGLFGFKRAYDEEFGRWSPGSLLDLDVLDRFHRSARLA